MGHNRIFVYTVYNLLTQVYPLIKIQLHIPIAFGITALHSIATAEKLVCTANIETSAYKTVVTYQQIEVLN